MQFTTVFISMAIAALTSAAPILEKKQASGHATYYNTMYPTFSSCGEQPHDTDFIAALAPSFMPSACGKMIKVTTPDGSKSVTVKVVDTCMACAAGKVSVDLSPAAFTALAGSLDAGTVDASWSYAAA